MTKISIKTAEIDQNLIEMSENGARFDGINRFFVKISANSEFLTLKRSKFDLNWPKFQEKRSILVKFQGI